MSILLMIKSLESLLEKQKWTHEHDGLPRHPVSVKHHQEYFARSGQAGGISAPRAAETAMPKRRQVGEFTIGSRIEDGIPVIWARRAGDPTRYEIDSTDLSWGSRETTRAGRFEEADAERQRLLNGWAAKSPKEIEDALKDARKLGDWYS